MLSPLLYLHLPHKHPALCKDNICVTEIKTNTHTHTHNSLPLSSCLGFYKVTLSMCCQRALQKYPSFFSSSLNNSGVNPGAPLVSNCDSECFNVYNLLYNLIFAMNNCYKGSIRNTGILNLKGSCISLLGEGITTASFVKQY